MKRVFFISFLFVIFQSVNAFCSLSVEDFKQMEIEGKEPNWNEITQDQTSYENWLDYLTEKTNAHYDMPDFSTVADLTENLLAYAVGNYADVASGVFDNISDYFSLGSDIWDFMTFNVGMMAFDYAPDFANLMREKVDDVIYVDSDVSIVGNWQLAPDSGATCFWENSYGNRSYIQHASGGACYVAVISTNSRQRIYSSADQNARIKTSQWGSTTSFSTWHALNQTYVVDDNTYYYYVEIDSTTSYSMPGTYGSVYGALADLWGNGEPSGEPILTNAIIVNENPVVNPVTLTSALGYPYKETIINNYNNNTPIPWQPNNYNYVDYNYNYEVPFWGGQELETLDYPTEIEFPSVDFETVAVDSSADSAIEGLSGWIIEFLLIAILLLVLGLII